MLKLNVYKNQDDETIELVFIDNVHGNDVILNVSKNNEVREVISNLEEDEVMNIVNLYDKLNQMLNYYLYEE